MLWQQYFFAQVSSFVLLRRNICNGYISVKWGQRVRLLQPQAMAWDGPQMIKSVAEMCRIRVHFNFRFDVIVENQCCILFQVFLAAVQQCVKLEDTQELA